MTTSVAMTMMVTIMMMKLMMMMMAIRIPMMAMTREGWKVILCTPS